MSQTTVVHHPLIAAKLSKMRDEKTSSKEFRESLDEIASLMCFEVFKDVKTHESEETTHQQDAHSTESNLITKLFLLQFSEQVLEWLMESEQ